MEQNSKSVTEVIIHSVASETQTDPLELPPLYGAVDPDKLEEHFNSSADGGSPSQLQALTFEYAGCEIRLDVNDCAAISEPDVSLQRDPQWNC